MSIRSQDKKSAILTSTVVILWFGISLTLLDMSVTQASTGSAGLAISVPLIYLMKRRSSYLTTLIKQYCKEQKRKELEAAAVRAAYGQYRLALIEFKLELKNNPDNTLLKEIVSLIEELENGRKIFT